MPKCIYCKRTLVADASDGSQPSREHIIQYAIGGPNSLCTWEVCTDCNSKLGDTVDADFINQQVIAMLRQQHGLTGYSKKLAVVSMEARSQDNNEPARIAFEGDGDVTVKHRPVVLNEDKIDGTQEWLVAGQLEDVEQIAEGIIKKARSTGRKILTASGKEALTAKDLLAVGTSERSGHYKAVVSFDPTAILRGYAKIAFGFMHLIAGPTWTFSQRAEPLRALARGETGSENAKSFVKQARSGIRAKFAGEEPEGTTSHLVGLLPSHNGMVVVSLFGGTFSYVFTTGPLTDDQLLDIATTGAGIAVVVEPAGRGERWIPFATVAGALMKQTDPH